MSGVCELVFEGADGRSHLVVERGSLPLSVAAVEQARGSQEEVREG